MQRPRCVGPRCHMSTDDVSHTEVRLQPWEVAADELCITEGMRRGWEDIDGDKKMYEYKSKARWGEAALGWERSDRIEVWNELKATNAGETRTVRSEWDWDSILEMIPCSFPALYPRGCRHLLPHPVSCLTMSTKILSSRLHPMHSFSIHTHTYSGICKHRSTKTCMFITLPGSLSSLQHKQTLPRIYTCNTHTGSCSSA